jgi:hypothetical protein
MSERNRRSFLRNAIALSLLGPLAQAGESAAADQPINIDPRSKSALQMRQQAAIFQCSQDLPYQTNNRDEITVPGYSGCFTKGLPHDQLGVVEPEAYESLLRALSSGQHSDFERINRGSGMKLVNPQSAFAYEMEGADSHRLMCPPAPSVSSAEAAAEMVELYWQALARDVAFSDYGTSPIIQAAVQDLSRLSNFTGPKLSDGSVSPGLAFRGPFAGCLDGPYISQFLLMPIPMNSTWLDQRYRVPIGGVDFLDTGPEWLVIQSGLPPYREYTFDPVPRYLSTGRGLAEWVHYDFLYQAFHNAALILLNQGPEAILNANPYYSRTNPYKYSKVQTGFATFGAPHVCSWLSRVTSAALEAAWYQKWVVHRRLRPEAFSGLVHATLLGAAQYPIASDLIRSGAIAANYQVRGNYLLPQAYPEGCPLHPAYPAGHATVAGACSIVLKAFFDESGLMTDSVVANSEGTSLLPYMDSGLTVGGEINKLVFNIAIGRNFAGIHYRSDAMAGFRLGEEVAIAKLQDLVNTLTEDFDGFRFTRLDGTPVQVSKQGSTVGSITHYS